MATDTPYNPPSRDPADDGSMLGMVKLILRKHLMDVDDMLPARVVSYDRQTNRASVVPLVKVLTTNNQQMGRAQVASVPVLLIGGGDVALSFPLKAGDLGWIKANDRDISNVLRSYADGAPNTLRLHSFQDAVFIPDAMRDVEISGEDTDSAVLQMKDGTARIAVGPDRVKFTVGGISLEITPTGVEIIGPLTTSGPVVVPQINIGGIPFATHKHTGVQSGGDNTGGPTA